MAGYRRPGPAPRVLKRREIHAILKSLRSGYGRIMACSRAGVPYRLLKRSMEADASLRQEVLSAEAIPAESVMYAVYQLRNHEDPRVVLAAASVFLDQTHRVEQARTAARLKRSEAGRTPERPDGRTVEAISGLLVKHVAEDDLPLVLAELAEVLG